MSLSFFALGPDGAVARLLFACGVQAAGDAQAQTVGAMTGGIDGRARTAWARWCRESMEW